MNVVAAAVVLGPIVAGLFVLQVEIFVAGGVVTVDDVDVVVDVGPVLMLPQLVGVSHLLELFWLNAVLIPMLGQVPVVSFVEVLAAA